jgi:hypothetical protein
MKKYLSEDMQIWEIENFLSEEELSIIDAHIDGAEWITQDGWANPVFFNNTTNLPDPSFIIKKINEATDNKYEWKTSGAIMRLQVGSKMNAHVDNYNASTELRKKKFISATLYLNDNFTGGELYYSRLNIDYTPKRGSLVVHPGFEEIYRHGVREVGTSDRYAMGLIAEDLTSKIEIV